MSDSLFQNRQNDETTPSRDLYAPKLLTMLREGYPWSGVSADVFAGFTVAIVALPLSMAIAIASGVGPDRGLYAAIVGGFFVSVLGGCRFQIGGPAGAFIVLVAATVDKWGVNGMIVATFMAGALLIVSGFLRLGRYIRYIPYPVVVGFTAGIALIIFSSQIKELLGLSLPGKEPGELAPKLLSLALAWKSFNVWAFAIGLLTIALIVILKRWRPQSPSLLIAVLTASLIAFVFHLPIDTIGARFGALPNHLPTPAVPDFSWTLVRGVAPHALAFALLGAMESLLSGLVAEGMTNRPLRANCELVAQGVANIASSLFGGLVVTGAIARTATNIRAGAYGPLSGVAHCAILLAMLMIAAPLASYIPLPALAGVLMIVAWNMAERHEIKTIFNTRRDEVLVLAVTFLVTIFRDLIEGIGAGFALSALFLIARKAQSARVATVQITSAIVAAKIEGAMFFGDAFAIGAQLEKVGANQSAMILDVASAPLRDATAANVLARALEKIISGGARVFIVGASQDATRLLTIFAQNDVAWRFRSSIAEALNEAQLEVGVAGAL